MKSNLLETLKNFNLKEEKKPRGQINQKYTFLHDNIMKVINKNAPVKKLTREELKDAKNDTKRHIHFS